MFRMFAILLLVSGFIGCGGSKAPPTAKVSGTVTFKGEPLANAKVLFISASGRPAQGESDAAGKFTLTTDKPGDGAVIGDHVIVVTKLGPPAGMSESEFQEKLKTAGPGNAVQAKSVIPEKYTMSSTSPLKCSVPPAGNPNVEVKLE